MKKILLLLLLILSPPVFAADNAVILTPGAGVTMRCKDVGSGVQSCVTILGDTAGNPIISGGAVPVVISPSTASSGLATSANQATEIASLSTIASNTGASIPAGTAAIGGLLEYPINTTPITKSITGSSVTTATFAAVSGVTNYLCGFSIRANATAAATGNSTVTGISPANLNFAQWTAPLASGMGITEMVFRPCLQASASNTAISVISDNPGSGGVASVTSWGFRQ